MSETFQATYEGGVLRPDRPLALPELTRVVVFVQPATAQMPPPEPVSDEEFFRELDELAWDAPPLPADFSRADLYLDHD